MQRYARVGPESAREHNRTDFTTPKAPAKRNAISLFLIATFLGILPSVLSYAQTQSSQPAQPTTVAPSPSANSQVYDVVVQRNARMKTRDGVTLLADVYRPDSPDKFPVILMRTPYDKSAGWAVAGAFKIVPHGYVVVIQDVRGRYTSEGEWYPFRHEQNDGYDAVEWAAALENSNGKVGMMGASYVGATQMLAAIANPPHLAAIAPNMTASNYHDGWTYQSGAFEQWFDQNWTT